jgi:hypothetical protein
MAEKILMSELRAQYPMYADVSDEKLLSALHKKHYADLPIGKLVERIDFDTQRADPSEGEGNFEIGFPGIGTIDTGLKTPQWLNRGLAGAGKSFADVGRVGKRVANAVGVGDYDQAAAAEDAQRDKALMNTTAGTVGKFIGDAALTAVPGFKAQQGITQGVQAGAKVLPAALAAATRFAAPYLGATVAGAGTGFALSPEDLSGGTKMGAVSGLGGEVAGRVVSGLYGGAKAALEPLTEGGRERILKRTLGRFTKGNADDVLKAAQNPEVLVRGYNPTLAEATGDAGLAQLQRGAQTVPSVANELADATKERIAAYKAVLDDLAGNDGKREMFAAARKNTADELFAKARAEGLQLTPELEQQFATLMQRPSVQSALPKARALALEKGVDLGASPGGSVTGLHWVKEGLDDAISNANTAGSNKLAGAIRDTQDELVGALQKGSPRYGEAMAEYEAMSRPINQMDVGQRLRDTLFPAMSDFSENSTRLRGANFTEALRHGDDTAKAATGLRAATLKGTLEPEQLGQVQGIAKDIARNTATAELGKIPGSPTAQYMGAHNILRGMLGPLGMPESALDHAAGRVAKGLLSLPFSFTASQTEELLARAIRDPKFAAVLMKTKDDPTLIAKFLQPYAAQMAIQSGTE